MFNIPEGNLKESPTSYMSITNQKLTSVIVAEEAANTKAANDTGKKEKPAAAKPAAAPAKSAASSGGSEAELDQKIREVGDKVRDLKTNKAAKVSFSKKRLRMKLLIIIINFLV